MILKINMHLKPEAFLWAMIYKQIENSQGTLFLRIPGNCSKIIICTDVIRANITYNGGMKDKDDGNWKDGQTNIFD